MQSFPLNSSKFHHRQPKLSGFRQHDNCVMALLSEFVWEIHRSYGIVQNKGKKNKIDLPFLVVYITSVSMAFGGFLERF